jgi:hypothetical protein
MMKRLMVICIAVFLSFIAGIGLGAGPSEIASAAERGDRAAVRTLIARKADVNALSRMVRQRFTGRSTVTIPR